MGGTGLLSRPRRGFAMGDRGGELLLVASADEVERHNLAVVGTITVEMGTLVDRPRQSPAPPAPRAGDVTGPRKRQNRC